MSRVEDMGGEARCFECDRVVDGDLCDHCGAARRLPGVTLLGIREHGAQGRVYVAESDQGRRVAVKELLYTRAPTAEAIEAFEREARFLQSLEHPQIPRFVASFTYGEGVHTRQYLVQEYVDGESLVELMRRHRFSEEELEQIATQVLAILVYLQGLSPMVFHRDIKPANLVRRADGSIVLVDFGAARDLGATANATIVGTFGYMPTEQLAGIVDATTDLFGLGMSLWHLATRTEPWKLDERARSKAQLSRRFRAFLDRLTRPKPTDRYGGARDALAALCEPGRTRWLGVALGAASVVAFGVGFFTVQQLVPEGVGRPGPLGEQVSEPEPTPSRSVRVPAKRAPSPPPKADPYRPQRALPSALVRTPTCVFGALDVNKDCRRGDFLVARYPTDIGGAGKILEYKLGKGLLVDRPVHLPDSHLADLRLRAVAVDPEGPTYYAMNARGQAPAVGELRVTGTDMHGLRFQWIGLSGRRINGRDDPGDGLPNWFGVRGLTFDSRRRRLVVNAHSQLHTYSVDDKTWAGLKEHGGRNLTGLVYSKKEDVIYSVVNGGRKLLRLSAEDGGLIEERSIVDPIHPDRRRGHFFDQIGLVGNNLVLIGWKYDEDRMLQPECEVLDLETTTVLRDECD